MWVHRRAWFHVRRCLEVGGRRRAWRLCCVPARSARFPMSRLSRSAPRRVARERSWRGRCRTRWSRCRTCRCRSTATARGSRSPTLTATAGWTWCSAGCTARRRCSGTGAGRAVRRSTPSRSNSSGRARWPSWTWTATDTRTSSPRGPTSVRGGCAAAVAAPSGPWMTNGSSPATPSTRWRGTISMATRTSTWSAPPTTPSWSDTRRWRHTGTS